MPRVVQIRAVKATKKRPKKENDGKGEESSAEKLEDIRDLKAALIGGRAHRLVR